MRNESEKSQIRLEQMQLYTPQSYLVGDYDRSELYKEATCNYTNIVSGLVEEYTTFIGSKDLTLEYTPTGD